MVRRPTAKCAQNLEQVACALLRPNPRNARKHSVKQIEHLKAIIARVGFVQPVLIDRDNRLIAGHGRLDAAKQLGIEAIPAIRLAHLNEAELRVLALADNRIAELAEWDEEALKLELGELIVEDLDFSISDVTGFESAAIDAVLETDDFGAPGPDDALAPLPQEPPITRLGDIWRLGPHLVACGDARDSAIYDALLGEEPAQLVIGDGPFNVPIEGHVCGKGKHRHREFQMAVGEMSAEEFAAFNRDWLERAAAHARAGALLYAFIDGLHIAELVQGGRDAGLALLALCTWAKTNGGMGALYRSQTEHIAVFKSAGARHINNVQLGRFGRNRSTLWTHPGMNAFGRGRDAALRQHPTVKPVRLIGDIMLDASERGQAVLDPFLGSGSSVVAAHRTGRRCFGVELDPIHVDASLARCAAVLGVDPVRTADGAPWSQLKEASHGKR